jgi:hypothetical protein
MSHIGQLIEFESAAFSRCDKDEELVNHDTMYGYELARFIADRLPSRGFTADALIAEDWGWLGEIENEGFLLAYGCTGEGEDDGFLIQIIPHTPTIRRWFKTIDVSERVEALGDAVFAILAESGKAIKGPAWSG